jgi:hypothetical protein
VWVFLAAFLFALLLPVILIATAFWVAGYLLVKVVFVCSTLFSRG